MHEVMRSPVTISIFTQKNLQINPVNIPKIYFMESETKLTLTKTIHTAIWIFFNFVIFYMLYTAIVYSSKLIETNNEI
jgi:hypothetical protein